MFSVNSLSLFFLIFLTEIATDLYIPSLPLLPDIFSTTIALAQATMSFHLIGFAIGQPIWGILSDRFDRRKTLLFGFTFFIISSLACAFSHTIHSLIFFRFLQGIGGSSGPVIGLALLKESSESSVIMIKRVSFLTTLLSISPIIGPILGGAFLSFYGWQINFHSIALAGALAMIFFSLQFQGMTKSLSSPCSPVSSKLFLLPLLAVNALLVSCVWIFITEAPFFLIQKFKISPVYYGFYQSATVIFYILGSVITNRGIQHWAAAKILKIGLILITTASISLLTFTLSESLTPLNFLSSFCIFELGLGITRPLLIDKILNARTNMIGAVSASIGFCEISLSSLFLLVLPYISSFLFLACIPLIAISIYIFSLYTNESKSWEFFSPPKGVDE